jgi:putative membrane protein
VITFDRTAWWGTCFSWWGTVLPLVLPRVALFTTFCLALAALDRFVLAHLGEQPEKAHDKKAAAAHDRKAPAAHEKSAYQLPEISPLGHTILGVSLSLLIVFRTNGANQRFWEARTYWGAIINASRDLVRMASTFAPPADELARMVSAYVILLKEQLRDNRDLTGIRHLVPGRVMERLEKANNPAQVLAASLTEWIVARLREGRIDTGNSGRMEGYVAVMVDNQGGCEKIRRTPVPFIYAALLRQILALYLLTLPFVLVPLMGMLAPFVVTGVSLGMLGIEEAGVEIEDPFGLDPNHLPLDQICAEIGRDVTDLAAGDRK